MANEDPAPAENCAYVSCAHAYVLNVLGVLTDLDMDKVKSWFKKEGEREMLEAFGQRGMLETLTSPDFVAGSSLHIGPLTERKFKSILEKGVLSGYISANKVDGAEEVLEAILCDPVGNLVLYDRGITPATAYALLEVVGLKEERKAMIYDAKERKHRPSRFGSPKEGLFVLDAQACGLKDDPLSYMRLQRELIGFGHDNVRSNYTTRAILRPRLIIDTEKNNAEAAVKGMEQSEYCRTIWLDRNETGERSTAQVLPNLHQLAGFIKAIGVQETARYIQSMKIPKTGANYQFTWDLWRYPN